MRRRVRGCGELHSNNRRARRKLRFAAAIDSGGIRVFLGRLDMHSTSATMLWIAAFAVFTAAGVVKGVIGLGLPTLSMALLAQWMAPAEAAALLIVPSLITNVWQMKPWATLAQTMRRLGWMQCGIVAGTLATAATFGAPAGAWATIALGVVLIAYATVGLTGGAWVIPSRCERWLSPIVGATTGMVTAITGVFVVPAVPYLQALGMRRDELIQSMGLSFTTSTLALAVALGASHVYSPTGAIASTAMLVPALIGMALGQWLRSRLSVVVFRRAFFVSLALLGVFMATGGWLH
jgi:uncharacterized protein